MSSSGPIESFDVGAARVLRLSHGKANALDVELFEALTAALEEATEDGCRALVLTGTGSIFSAGVDLVRLLNDGGQYRGALLKALGEALHALLTYPKPLIAAINGHAIAGGCIVACAADHRIMIREHGRIGVPELTVGVPFPPMALEILRFATPPQYFRQLVYRGLTYSSDHAHACGLVDELVAVEALSDRALACATELASIPPNSFALTKSQAVRPVIERLQQQWSQDIDVQVNEAWNSEDTVTAVQQYVDTTLRKR